MIDLTLTRNLANYLFYLVIFILIGAKSYIIVMLGNGAIYASYTGSNQYALTLEL
jgi:hypothetical protein